MFALVSGGCRSTEVETSAPGPAWDLTRSEVLGWCAEDTAFAQNRALEASGLAVLDGALYVASEKYGRLLRVDIEGSFAAQVIRIEVPRYSELEGIAFSDHTAYLCDEAHASVYAVDLAADRTGSPLASRSLPLRGLEIRGGKVGLEGVAVAPGGSRLYLLLERGRGLGEGCVATIFPMEIRPDELAAVGDPILIGLEDCAWRLTALEMWQGRLLALKTQYPGGQYQVIAIDPETGSWRVVLELTELLRSLEREGWNNNIEGLAVTSDGSLYIVSDNKVSGVTDEPVPPPADQRTLLLRIPPK